MGIVNNALSGASGQSSGYNLTNSLRFRSSANAYLSRTGSTATNAKLATYSFWFKRGALTTGQWIFTGGASGATTLIGFNGSSDALSVLLTDVSGEGNITTAVFRDPSAWYHFVIAIDTTQATTADRAKIYVNGVLQTVTVSNGGIGSNANWGFNTANTLNIGRYTGGSSYTDGYLAETNFIDGQALTPSSFGQTSTTTGVWIPKKYTGTYGTNGFYLPFTNTASTSTLGNDFSGNSNTWTVNNISLTAGTTYDSMTDVPTLTSATAANYAVWNPLILARNFDSNPQTITNGNLVSQFTSNTTAGKFGGASTIGVSSGKWYCEIVVTEGGTYPTYTNLGITGDPMYNATVTNASLGGQDYSVAWYNANGNVYRNGSSLFSGSTQTAPYTAMIALDVDAGKIYFGFNGTWINSANPAVGTGGFNILAVSSTPTGQYFISCFFASTGMQGSYTLNAGQQPFAYTPPTGFNRLNTFNLPTPTIGATASTTANKYFDATTYTGNGTSGRVLGNAGGFQADLVWIKGRTVAWNHQLADIIRGGGKSLQSNLTDAEVTNEQYGYVSAFSSSGFTLTTGSLGADLVNNNTSPYVAWQWKANGTGVTNTAGSITSTVSANTSAGFSIVTYTGIGGAGSVGHGLGVEPRIIIIKSRSSATGWRVYSANLGITSYLLLNSSSAVATASMWGTPNSTTFIIGGTGYEVNETGATYVAYCFAPVAGYSAFGSYTGNGSTDGAFIFTGFRPKYIMMKSTSTESWELFDTSRSSFNQAVALLEADASGSENTSSTSAIDILSNGFKQRNTRAATNGSGTTYIYMAFAENPFKYSNAR
jgi:hypothetical protein